MSAPKHKTETAPLTWSEFETLTSKLVMDIQVHKQLSRCRILMGAAVSTYCGLRAGDMLTLRWRDLVSHQSLSIIEQKTGKRRDITLNTNLQNLVASIYTTLNSPPVDHFIMGSNRSKGTAPISIQYYNREISEVFYQYGIRTQNPSSHTFRKTFGLRVFETNNRTEEALIVLSQIFNHSSISITRRYIGLQQQRITDVYLSL
jgi:integrase